MLQLLSACDVGCCCCCVLCWYVLFLFGVLVARHCCCNCLAHVLLAVAVPVCCDGLDCYLLLFAVGSHV